MGQDLDTMTYMIAAEKMINMLFTIEQTMTFMEEYKVDADEEVKKALAPLVAQLQQWIK